jgi:nucleotide-binding universal stress UspA family protein
MQAIRRVLVAVKEPAARSQPAAAKAAQLARGLGAPLELFHAIDTPLYVDLVRMRGATIEEAKLQLRSQRLRQLERIASRLRVPGLRVTVAADWDFPGHEAIVRHAGRTGAGLIVAQRHAGRHVAPWLLHMTDWELLRLSPMPLRSIGWGATCW